MSKGVKPIFMHSYLIKNITNPQLMERAIIILKFIIFSLVKWFDMNAKLFNIIKVNDSVIQLMCSWLRKSIRD